MICIASRHLFIVLFLTCWGRKGQCWTVCAYVPHNGWLDTWITYLPCDRIRKLTVCADRERTGLGKPWENFSMHFGFTFGLGPPWDHYPWVHWHGEERSDATFDLFWHRTFLFLYLLCSNPESAAPLGVTKIRRSSIPTLSPACVCHLIFSLYVASTYYR